jgi:hypothetical protein
MSRASWYRHGKPQTKPLFRITQSAAPALYAVGVRSVQRVRRIQRYAPDLAELAAAGKLTHGEAERLLIARQDRALLAGERTIAANAARKRRDRQARRLL